MHNGVLRLKVYVDLEIYAEGGFESLWAWVLASGTLEESQFSRPSVVRPRPKSITSSHHIPLDLSPHWPIDRSEAERDTNNHHHQ